MNVAASRCLFLALLLFSMTFQGAAATLVDDREITIKTANDVVVKRQALIEYIWGDAGFPNKGLPSAVLTNVSSPVQHLTNLARVDEFRFDMAPGLQGLAYHFVPHRPNSQLAIVHHGHACTLDDDPSPAEVGYGLQRTIAALLGEGYGVLGVFMPHMRPGDCTGNHGALFQTKTTGSPLKFFVEPVALSLNYLKTQSEADHFPKYRKFDMIGLSGGGWTTTLYAALDPTILCSVPVAGSIPLYLRTGASIGDQEQFESTFYSLAGYPDLYVLGAFGAGRKQIQVLVRKDDCCFGAAQHDEKSAGLPYLEAMQQYAGKVSAALANLGQGAYRLEIDEVAPSHMISHHAIEEIILPALREKL